MKKLHLIGFTPDNEGLVLSPRKGAKSGGFVVPLDDSLVAAIELARRLRDGVAPDRPGPGGGPAGSRAAVARPTSSLSPREIQARLRAGSTIAEVASQAGVGDEWVQRFAAPILAEQAQVVGSAQRLTLVKARRGPSIEPLAPSVQWNLSDKGVQFSDDVFADSWSAYNLHGARWAVRFAYTSRKRRQVAEWEVDLRERSLVARNRLATELGHVAEGRRRPSVEPADAGAAGSNPPAPTGPTGRRGAAGSPAKAATAKGPAAPRARPAGARAAGAPGAVPAATAKQAAGAKAKAAATARAAAGAKAKAVAPTAKPAAGARATPAVGAGRKAGPAGALPAAGSRAKVAARGAGAKKAAAAKGGGLPPAARRVGPVPAPAAAKAAVKGSPTRGAARGAVAPSPAGQQAGRASSPRKARPAKKPAAETPGAARPPLAVTPVEVRAERPSHLGRPPSPMKSANRAIPTPPWAAARPSTPRGAAPPVGSRGAVGLTPSPPSRPTVDRHPPATSAPASRPSPSTASRPPAATPPSPSRPTPAGAPAPRSAVDGGASLRPPVSASTGEPAGRAVIVRAEPAGAAPSPEATRSADGPPTPAPPTPAGPGSAAPAAPRPGSANPAPVPQSAAGAAGAGGPAVVILPRRGTARVTGDGPEGEERRARLASAERLRAALAGDAPPGGGDAAPRR